MRVMFSTSEKRKTKPTTRPNNKNKHLSSRPRALLTPQLVLRQVSGPIKEIFFPKVKIQ